VGSSWGSSWLSSWGASWGGTTPPPVNPYLSGGPGFHLRPPREREDDRHVDRAELRRMLEAAFADAPRDPVVKAVKRAHPIAEKTVRSIPRVDWSALLADAEACERVLVRYASRIAAGATRTQRREKAREELSYSTDAIDDMLRTMRSARLARRRRAARAALLLL